MLLFFYFILAFFIGLMLLILLVLFSQIKITISELEFTWNSNQYKTTFNGKFSLYFLGKIKIYSTKISNGNSSKLLNKGILKDKLKKLKNKRINYNKKTQLIRTVKFFKQCENWIKLDSLNSKLYIDTKDVVITSYLIGVISAIIPNVLKHYINNYNYNAYDWKVIPIYNNQNHIYLKLSSIISIKVVHIINMLNVIGGTKNERTSNRKLGINCHGKY